MKKRIARLCAALAALLLLAGGMSGAAETAGGAPPVGEGFLPVAENAAGRLYVCLDTAEVLIEEKQSGTRWYTNPQPAEQVSDEQRQDALAQLIVSYQDQNLNIATADSARSCIEPGTYEIRLDGQALVITYDFSRETQRFRIPLRIELTQRGFTAQLLFDQIEEYGTAKVCQIDVLPYFGAVPHGSQEGYLFLPDGSGALADLADAHKNATAYRKTVYGSDPATGLLEQSSESSAIRMPVFGEKLGSDAFFAIITAGDADAQIFADMAQERGLFPSIGASFVYRQRDLTGIPGKTADMREMNMVDGRTVRTSPVVEYRFLHGADADYSGMAREYRRYLLDRYGERLTVRDETPGVSLEIFGLTEKKTAFLGIPITKKVTATTFAQAAAIGRELTADGGGLRMALYGFCSGGYRAKTNGRLTFDRRVGGIGGYRALLDAVGDGTVYTVAGLARDYHVSGLPWHTGRYVQSMNKLKLKRRTVLPGTGAWDDGAAVWGYLRAERLAPLAKKLTGSLPGGGIVFENMGEELYSDFSDASDAQRQTTLAGYRTALAAAAENTAHIGAEGGNVYLLGYADWLYEIPLTSGKHDLFCTDVPFYSMVLHGLIPLSSADLGESAFPEEAIGEAVACGVSPLFRICENDPAELSGTAFSALIGARYADRRDLIGQAAQLMQELQAGLQNVPIERHDYVGALSVTVYENGTALVHNRADHALRYLDIEIRPYGVAAIRTEGGDPR